MTGLLRATAFEYEVTDFDFDPPEFFQGEDPPPPGGSCDPSFPIHFPDHPGFGAVSAVGVPLRAMPDPSGLVSGDSSKKDLCVWSNTRVPKMRKW
jgi:hypothetical protein